MSTPNPLADLLAKELADRKASGWSKEPLPPPKALPPLPPGTAKALEPAPTFTHEKLGTLIVNLFVLKGRDHTIPELAAHAGVSTKTVLDLLAKGMPEGVTGVMRKRGKERVRVYGPTREHLRLLIGRSE